MFLKTKFIYTFALRQMKTLKRDMMENSARNTIVKLLLTAVAFTVMATSSFASSIPQDKKTVTVEGIVMGGQTKNF